jgi:hypothetical protein
MSRTKYLWLYVNRNNLMDRYDCVEELCIMVVDRKGDHEFTVSFDPDSQLLAEKGQVNLMKDGQGTPMADYHLYQDTDVPAVIERDGKQYRVWLRTWDLEKAAPEIGLFFEIEIDDLPSTPPGPAASSPSS